MDIPGLIKIASLTAIWGWTASLVSPFLGTLLGHQSWDHTVGDTVVTISGVMVLALAGLSVTWPRERTRAWAKVATWCSVLGVIACLLLRVIVSHVLDRQEATIVVRDAIWPLLYGGTLALIVALVVLWSMYLRRLRVDDG